VRVLLERNVYQTPRINDAVIEKLSKVGISTKYTSENFTFTHMKLWFIDRMWCVSTGNWSYTSFTKNREFIFCSEDILAMKSLEEIFLSDYQYRTPNFQSG
jgi:phosphatidylserine/phosphatidylglycerophosphate/cardiolipin synthase-like enzyme